MSTEEEIVRLRRRVARLERILSTLCPALFALVKESERLLGS